MKKMLIMIVWYNKMIRTVSQRYIWKRDLYHSKYKFILYVCVIYVRTNYLFSVFFIIKINSALIISTVVLGTKFFINVLSKHQRIIVTLFMFLEYPPCKNHLITFQHKALFICFVSESSYLLAPERNLHIKPFNLVGFYRKPIPTNSLSELQLMLTVQVLSYICLLTVSLKFIKILTFYLICTTSNLGGGGAIFWHHFNFLDLSSLQQFDKTVHTQSCFMDMILSVQMFYCLLIVFTAVKCLGRRNIIIWKMMLVWF